jgi:hypothetical protein
MDTSCLGKSIYDRCTSGEYIQRVLNSKIDLKLFSFIDFALRFIIFICSKKISHLFTNFDAKSMSKKDFEPIFEFKTLSTYLFPLHMHVVLKKQEKEKVNVNEPPLNIT